MNRPPIKIECLECFREMDCDNCVNVNKFNICHLHGVCDEYKPICRSDCHDGPEFNYLTPEQWEEQTGEKMLDSDRVWIFSENIKGEVINISNHDFAYYIAHHKEKLAIVARTGQPKPDDNWRLS